MSWEREDTERWLNDWPLPADFTWNGEKAWPTYQLKTGYGKWLKEAGPYHVPLRGLFQLCHQMLEKIPVGHPLPKPEQLAAKLKAAAAFPTGLPFGETVLPANFPGVDFAAKLRAKTDAPTATTSTSDPA